MYIKNLKAKNFKCFKDLDINFCIPNGNVGSGLNILVGENNCGKSSLFEAIHFIRNSSNKNIVKIDSETESIHEVEMTFTQNITNSIESFVQDNKKSTFKDCIEIVDEIEIFNVKRDFHDDDKRKKILFKTESGFKNVAGIDGVFKSFFQISNIWADTNPESESKFGSTTVCGNLLSEISSKFQNDNPEYETFINLFNDLFNNDQGGLQNELNILSKETEEILNEQFGSASLKFQFNPPEPSVLFKNIKILVNDGEQTDISEKGHGLQRAIILSLLQVYAQRISNIENDEGVLMNKPHFLFIDEPELGLHPQAQKKLFNALKILSKYHQVFINSHSENFISLGTIENIYKFIKKDEDIQINNISSLNININENRIFFFHHHKLFFGKIAIFVEGIDDYENYPIFCEQEGFTSLKSHFYLMNGCGGHNKFNKLCEFLGITVYFILDIDVIGVNSSAKSGFPTEIKSNIDLLNIECKKKDPSNLFDENLTQNQKKIKYKIIEDLKLKKYFILTQGAYEQYFLNGDTRDESKKTELIGYFNEIKNSL